MSLSVGSPAADILLTYWSMNMNMKAKQNKLSVAIERAIRAENFYVVGESLGFEEIVTAEYWVGALKSLKKPADRVAMRAGFVAAYRCAHKSEAAAQKRFSRLAAMYSPQTSRKAKSNEAKAAEGEAIEAATDGADDSIVSTLSESQLKRNVLQATVMLAMLQTTADAAVAKSIGEVLAVLVQKGKKAAKAAAANVEAEEEEDNDA